MPTLPARRRPASRPDEPSLTISRRHIHTELSHHSAIVTQWAEWIAYIESRIEFLELKHEKLCAGHRKDIRVDLVATYGKSGVTERAVNDFLVDKPDFQVSAKKLHDYQAELRNAKAIYAGLDTKTKMLQTYVGLRRTEMDSLGDK